MAEYFYLLNETNWNKLDDAFFLINRRWFERWKDFVSYDYIVRSLVEQGLEVNMNRILATNNSNPGEISNVQLMMERKDFLQMRSAPDRLKFCNAPLK